MAFPNLCRFYYNLGTPPKSPLAPSLANFPLALYRISQKNCFLFFGRPLAYGVSGPGIRSKPVVATYATAAAMPNLEPTVPGRGLNLHPFQCSQAAVPQWALLPRNSLMQILFFHVNIFMLNLILLSFTFFFFCLLSF